MRINMGNFVPAVVAAIAFLGIIVSVLPYPMAAKRLPLVVSVIALLLLCIVIAQELLPKKKEPSGAQREGADDKRKKSDIPGKTLLVSAAWIMGVLVPIGFFGFTMGFSLYVTLYCRFHGGKWLESIVLGLGVAAFVYLVFIVGLDFLLPKGILFQLIGM